MFYELAEKAMQLERSGKKMIRLNVGDTNLPAPECALDAAQSKMAGMKMGYGSVSGMQELREKIAEREGCEIRNIAIGPGSKHLIFGLMSMLGKQGDTVAIPAPTWPAYEMICKQLGQNAKLVKTEMVQHWQYDSLPSAKLTIICNPVNPTSVVYDEKIIRKAIEDSKGNKSHIILDEAYKGLSYKPIPNFGIDGVIRVRSFSKEFNMESWRLAYAVADEEVVKKVVKFLQITATCVPEFIQAAGLACLENEKEITDGNRKAWKERMEAAKSALSKGEFKFAEPDSGIYIFPAHEEIEDAAPFAMKLLEQGVVVAPGESFGGYKRHFRVCVNQAPAVLEEAIGMMGEALKK